MVANSFDLWQKDSFFSAAEEVQESADIMESAYRRWVRERREGLNSEDLDELCRELQTTLGTAKWQLDEFERAVRLSYGHHSDDNRTARHRQFVVAIEDQISCVETALREFFTEQGKESLQWVNLDEEECDDLAMFLLGTSKTLQTGKDENAELRPCIQSTNGENRLKKKVVELNASAACIRDSHNMKASKDATINNDAMHVIEIDADEVSGTRDDVICQSDRTTGTRRTWSSPNFGAFKIAVPDEGEQRNKLLPISEATPKEKGSKPVFWKQRWGEHFQSKAAVNFSNQLFGRVSGFQRLAQSPRHLQMNCSVQFALALMLTIFLIVPFVFYSI